MNAIFIIFTLVWFGHLYKIEAHIKTTCQLSDRKCQENVHLYRAIESDAVLKRLDFLTGKIEIKIKS